MADRGRPKITLDDLPEGWEEQTLELFKEGASMLEIYTLVLDIDKETFARLRKEDDIFSETIKKGLQLSEAWWLKNGRAIRDKDFNATLWYMNMKNRFGWRDKTETDITSKGEQISVANPELAAGFADYLKNK